MARGALIAGTALALVGGAILAYGLTRTSSGSSSPQAAAALDAAIASLDSDLKVARTSVDQRAKTLSEVSLVRNAAATDPATMIDLVGKELSFKPEPGEVIELGKIPKGGAPVSLVVLPDGGMRASQSGKAGAATEMIEDRLLVTRTVEAVPLDPGLAAEASSYVTVSRPLELAPVVQRMTAAGLGGTIRVGPMRRPFGQPPAKDLPTVFRPVASEPSVIIEALVPATAGKMSVPLVGAGAGLAALGVILALIGLVGGRSEPGGTQTGMGRVGGTSPGASSNAPTPAVTGMLPGDPAAGSRVGIGPGSQIGRWEVVRRLGSGGMADVFLAHAKGEAGFEKLVALKVMHPHLARNQRAVDHFINEARLAARVTHPNVVQIQDLGKIGDDFVIVMDYVEGVDLERLLAAARLASRPVPVAVGLGILCRICDGLHAAHTARASDGSPLDLIHRDVKSANVLVSRQGGVKVVDFGIAKAATQSNLTIAGETKGTPSMMAPEQRVGEQVDVRADVYSVGAVAYEVLTGHAVNLDLAALAHLGVDNWPHLPPPTQLRPELPAELDQVLLTAMSYDRARRPADCAAFEAQFEAVMKHRQLTCSDKDIARWVEAEMAVLPTGIS